MWKEFRIIPVSNNDKKELMEMITSTFEYYEVFESEGSNIIIIRVRIKSE